MSTPATRASRVPTPERVHRPIWKGPLIDGITKSLCEKFLECPERFRLLTVEGLTEHQPYSHALEYGNIFHEALEAYSASQNPGNLQNKNHKTREPTTPGGIPFPNVSPQESPRDLAWQLPCSVAVKKYIGKLRAKYPESEKEIRKWEALFYQQFPLYVSYWEKVESRNNVVSQGAAHKQYLKQEECFRVPYTLPSGRQVTLRGKWDAVYRQGSSIYLQEHKVKGSIDVEGMQATLWSEFQTGLYLVALKEHYKNTKSNFGTTQKSRAIKPSDIKGVLYNVIRRPLSDRYSLYRRKTETGEQFYTRVGEKIAEKPEEYFYRFKAVISAGTLTRFKDECLHPILERVCDWYEHVSLNLENPFGNQQKPVAYPAPYLTTRDYDNFHKAWETEEERRAYVAGYHDASKKFTHGLHYRFPWGIYHSLATGWRGSYFNLLTRGSTATLQKVQTFYPELEEG